MWKPRGITAVRSVNWVGLFPKAPMLPASFKPRCRPRLIEAFEAELELSLERLQVQRVDLLAIHGINRHDHLEQTVRPGGCLDVVRRWQAEGRIGHVGFSTHGEPELIVDAIETDCFDYVNLHWYFIRQDNEPAIAAAHRHDMGVFIISPTDKGGHLHTPGPRLRELTAPLHPIVFNDLFCLRDPRVHTISVGASCPDDLVLHLDAVALLDQADALITPIEQSLHQAAREVLGGAWMDSWQQGLPHWQDTPGELNLPLLLWLHNLLEAWDLEGFVKARYGLLGRGGHWFPGSNADPLDATVTETDLLAVLQASPWRDQIPGILRRLRDRVGGERQERLSSA